jgi:hypothetical protein
MKKRDMEHLPWLAASEDLLLHPKKEKEQPRLKERK